MNAPVHRTALGLAFAALVFALSGCTVDTYCPKCVGDAQVVVDGGVEGGVDKVVATGGGGSVRHCAVAVPVSPERGAGAAPALGALAMAAMIGLRARRRAR